MEAGQDFVDTLPVYTIMPNPKPSFVASIKLSTDFLEHLQSKGAAGATICFSREGNVRASVPHQFGKHTLISYRSDHHKDVFYVEFFFVFWGFSHTLNHQHY